MSGRPRRVSKRDLKFARGRAAARRGRRKHPNVRARPVQKQEGYVAPGTWQEAAGQAVPSDPEHRMWYMSNVNRLVERDLALGRGVPVKQATAVWQRLERHRLERRAAMRASRDEPEWRKHAQALFRVACAVKFATHGATWARSTASGADFYGLCEAGVVVDADTPLFDYNMVQLRLALFRLVRRWRHLSYSSELARYVDHLERRVCAFLSGTFDASVFNYAPWCVRAPPSASAGRDMCAHQDFLTLMEIYFYELRHELSSYEALLSTAAAVGKGPSRVQPESGGLAAYELPAEAAERAAEWVRRVADSVYEEVVMEMFRDSYVESCLLPGEREFYEYKNEDAEGVADSAQSVISHFRADELDAIEGTTSLRLHEALRRGGQSRDLSVLSVLEFHYSSSHPGKGRSFSEEYLVPRENGSPLDLARHDPSAARRSSDQGPTSRDAGCSSDVVGRPVLMRAFHVWCVYDLSCGTLACGDLVTALCCWLERAFGEGRGDPLRSARRRSFARVEPKLRSAYRFIFKGEDERETEQMRAARLYEDVPHHEAVVLPWNPYAPQTTGAPTATAAV